MEKACLADRQGEHLCRVGREQELVGPLGVELRRDLDPAGGEERVAWKYAKGTGYIPSPILYGDYLYFLSDGGLFFGLHGKSRRALARLRHPL